MRKILLLGLVIPIFAFAQELPTPQSETPFPELQVQLDDIQVNIPKLEKILPNLPVTSEAVFAVNLDTQEVAFAKNEREQRAVASITKMMTAYVVLQQPGIDLNESITISQADVNLSNRAHRASKLRVGMHFTRERLLNLALMSSENTAAAALGRTTFKGGTDEFVKQMNEMATSLGMDNTSFEDPIGIGAENLSTASDLVRLVAAASSEELIREFSTTKFQPIQLPIIHSKKPTEYHNTNALVGFRDWNILVQKTGFTNAAGHCVIMVVDIQGQKFAIVVLDAADNQHRVLDAIKVREWLETSRTLTTDEAKPLSPYQFVLYQKGKPIPVHHRRHRKQP
jgi:D-alanyl-D-alanine endopeptidase (penicillin-binding protein 7)